ncbi:MAG: toxin-antitoxin antitoxin component [Methylocystaceae bacterium]|nr:MAG: toxin-antitoxin antitoxin component [Methylocystaceae bacterium]
MTDDVILNKAAVIERCVARARDEYERDAKAFALDFTRQDAAVLNILRACEAALDLGQHLIRRERLGLPQSARDVFSLLVAGGWIDAELAERLKRMVGYRNIAVHDYQALQLPITIAIIEKHLTDFTDLTSAIIRRDAARGQ